MKCQSLRKYVFIPAIIFSALAAFGGEPIADVSVSKTGPAIAAADTDVSYTVTVSSNGPNDATDITLNDNAPAGMTFVSVTPSANCTGTTCTIASLPAGNDAVFTYVFHIPAGTSDGTTFTNIATVSMAGDANDENNSAAANTSTPPAPVSDAFIMKDGPSSAGPDTDVVYTISVTNGGPDAASPLAWRDTLPGTMTFVSLVQDSGPVMNCTTGLKVSCSLSGFPAGATATFTLTGHIPAGTQPGTTFDNIANVAARNDPDGGNNSAFTTLTVSSADVSISKTGPAGSPTAGVPFSYTITIANAGPDTAVAAIWADTLPPDTTFVSVNQDNGPPASCGESSGVVTCTFLALPSGASAQFTLTITAGNTLSVTNTAIANSDSFDPNTNNNTSSATTPITPSANVSIVKSGPPAVTAGTNITYTISVSNAGPSDATNVVISDPAPANTTFVSATYTSGPAGSCTPCTVPTLPVGATTVFTYVFAVSPSTPNGTVITNIATVSAATSDPDGSNNSSSTSATVAPTADLAVTKTGPATVVSGTHMTYNVSLTNNGPSDAANVVLTDPLPPNTLVVSTNQTSGPTFNCSSNTVAITCTRASFAAGSTATFEFVLQFNGAPGSTITNSVTATSSTFDPTPGNATASAVTNAAAPGDGPTLSPLALALLSAVLAIAGMLVVRRS
ncbi:MAG TPA: IPTL-CTERM sorting domain-containing protein [Thermoanaerobaculia bacterium]|nr:IPTL-CTERM sorting domain-containing protein [Thermoanaerobaculia bacterium]